MLNLPELGGIQLFAAGVEPAKAGSAGCLRSAGFHLSHSEPDWEGVVYCLRFARSRSMPASSPVIP